jgi:hypothetical protein
MPDPADKTTITVTEVDKDGKTVDKSGPPLAKVKVASLGLSPEQVEAMIKAKQAKP